MLKKLFTKKEINKGKLEEVIKITTEVIPEKTFKIGNIYNDLIEESNKLIEQVKDYSTSHRSYQDDRMILLEDNEFTNSLYNKSNNITYQQKKVEIDNQNKILKEKRLLKEAVDYYKQTYPNCKFILKENVDKIITDYGAAYNNVKKYKGFVPNEQLKIIDDVKFLDEDIVICEEKYYRHENFNNPLIKLENIYYSKDYYDNYYNIIIRNLSNTNYDKCEHIELKTSIITSINNLYYKNINESEYNKEIKENIIIRYVRYENELEGYLIITNWND